MKAFTELDPDLQRDIVVSDVRDELGEAEAAELRESHNLRTWKTILVGLIEETKADSARKREAARSEGDDVEYRDWKTRQRYYQHRLELGLRECKDLIHEEAQTDYVAVLKRERSLLIEAIRKHRDGFPDEDDPSEADEELWGLLEQFGE